MENLIMRMLPLLRALAGPATLLLPWVRFDNESQYSNLLEAIAYVVTTGWMPIMGQNALPFGWTVLALLILIAGLTLRYLFKSLTGGPTVWTGLITMAAGSLWIVAAFPYYEAVSPAILGFYAVYGSEPAGTFINSRANRQQASASR